MPRCTILRVSEDDDANRWGLAALGVQGDVEVELHESLDCTRWTLQLTVGLYRLGVAAEEGVLQQLRQFFAETFRIGVYLDPEVAPVHASPDAASTNGGESGDMPAGLP